uniref:Uncharacterized protein n=1 Tax=Panagrolaimus sp. JU765 TaxID=591449 RepID=A0AC34Q850_9BILA
MSFLDSSRLSLIKEPTEVQLLTAAVTAFCSYIQRLTDLNDGVFPESLVKYHVSFIDAMRTELKDAMIMIDKRYAADFDDYVSHANITLDDVVVPKSFLDDGLELSFINSANAEPNENFFKDERPPSVASSVYFSASEEFEIDDTQSDFDLNESQPDLSLGFSVLGNNNVSILPAGDPLVDEVVSAAVDNQELFNNGNLIGELERDLFFEEKTLDESRPAEPVPPPSSMDFNKFDYRCRNLDFTQENDSSCSLISSFSSIASPKTPLRTIKTPEEKENEYIPSPSPSPVKLESSIDAITAALQIIKFGKSAPNLSRDHAELLDDDESTKLNENQKSTTEKVVEREFGRSPLRPKNESDV